MDNSKDIDFKFAKNWKSFLAWHDAYETKAKCSPMWDDQAKKIESCFESTNPNIVDWKSLWKDFAKWYKTLWDTKGIVLWAEQRRQIETCMLKQLNSLNSESFVLVYLMNGKPQVDSNTMNYWDAVRTKKELDGDSNGFGGDERMDKITIINLNKLIS